MNQELTYSLAADPLRFFFKLRLRDRSDDMRLRLAPVPAPVGVLGPVSAVVDDVAVEGWLGMNDTGTSISHSSPGSV